MCIQTGSCSFICICFFPFSLGPAAVLWSLRYSVVHSSPQIADSASGKGFLHGFFFLRREGSFKWTPTDRALRTKGMWLGGNGKDSYCETEVGEVGWIVQENINCISTEGEKLGIITKNTANTRVSLLFTGLEVSGFCYIQSDQD